MASLQDDTYKIIQRYAKASTVSNLLAFQLLLDHTEFKYLQKAINLTTPTQELLQRVPNRKQWMMGASLQDIEPVLNAQALYDQVLQMNNMHLDDKGNVVPNEVDISGNA